MTTHEISFMFLSLGILLTAARIMGELARMFNQPMVLGEILAGILLGPTVLGACAPDFSAMLFPRSGPNAIVLHGLTTISATLFLLVAGMELDLSKVWRQGRTAITVSLAGIIIPFAIGFTAAYASPKMLGREHDADLMTFALFIATALSISALPVIAKTLIDLSLFRSDLGMVVVASAIFDDLFGWIVFAIILSMMGHGAHSGVGIPMTIVMTIGFAVLTLTVGRKLMHRLLPWIQAYLSWPGGVLGFALGLALLGAAFTEWIGIHAIFGAFLVGVAIGDSSHLRQQTRTILHEFISFIFAPFFFASIGLRVNFAAHFDLQLTLIVLVIACLGKIIGCGLGARLCGMRRREALAVGFGLNARGAMEIILGMLALEAGLISERLFIALVIMALVTSMISGPMMQRLLQSKRPRRFFDHLSARSFLVRLHATERRKAIRELARVMAGAAGLEEKEIEQAVWAREKIVSTGLGRGLAIPHARLATLSAPVVGIALSERGIDFDAQDGKPAHLVCMILTPSHDSRAHLEIMTDLVRLLSRDSFLHDALRVANYTEFLALVRSGSAGEARSTSIARPEGHAGTEHPHQPAWGGQISEVAREAV